MQLITILVSNALLGLLSYFFNISRVSATVITIISILISLFFVAEGFIFYKVRKRHLLLLPALSILAYIINSFFLFYTVKYNVLGIILDLLYGGSHIYMLCSMPLFYSDNYIALKILDKISLFVPWLLVICGITLGRKVNKEKYLRHLETKNYKPLSNVSRIILNFMPIIILNTAYFIGDHFLPLYESDHTAYTLLSVALNLFLFTLLIQPFYVSFLNKSASNKKASFILTLGSLLFVDLELYIIAIISSDIQAILMLLAFTGVRLLFFAISCLILFCYRNRGNSE